MAGSLPCRHRRTCRHSEPRRHGRQRERRDLHDHRLPRGADSPAVDVVSANGLTISAACDAAGTLLLSLSSASGDAQYALLATDDTGNVRGDSFNAWTGEPFDIAARLGLPDLSRESLHLTYQNPAGKPVLVDIAADSGAFNGATSCYAGGYAIS